MLKKICLFSFIASLICLISLICITPFAIKDVLNSFSTIGDTFLIKQSYLIPSNELTNINTISFETTNETYVKLVQTDTKEDEILIRHHSILGETAKFIVSEKNSILTIEQELEKIEQSPPFIDDFRNFSYVDNIIEIHFPKNFDINLAGGAFSFDGKSDDFIVTNELTVGDIRKISTFMGDSLIDMFTASNLDEFSELSKEFISECYILLQKSKIFDTIY